MFVLAYVIHMNVLLHSFIARIKFLVVATLQPKGIAGQQLEIVLSWVGLAKHEDYIITSIAL